MPVRILTLLVLTLLPGISRGSPTPADPIVVSSQSLLLRMDEGTGTATYAARFNKSCGFANSPAWVTGLHGLAIKFDNTNAGMTCTEADMPYGGRPRTVMFVYYSTSPAHKVSGGDKWLFKFGTDAAATFWASSIRNDCGGCVSIWPSDSNQYSLTSLKLSSSTWNVVTFTTWGSGNPVRGFVVTKDRILREYTTSVTMNTLPGDVQIGRWATAAQDAVATIDEFAIYNRGMTDEEVIALSRRILTAAVQPQLQRQ